VQATRQEIIDFLRRNGQASIRDLSAAVGLTSTGVRQHLTVLQRDGLVEAQETRGRVGRPALVYRLTERGQHLHPKQYHVLANAMLDELKAKTGAAGMLAVLRGVADRIVEANLPRVEGKDFSGRVAETLALMREQDLVVELEERGAEFLLHECTCPYPAVAPKHPGVCALEVTVISRLTGGDARLTSSLLRGDRSCTYRIRPAAARRG
jgi:predicted ArsR family transcriptional regulator